MIDKWIYRVCDILDKAMSWIDNIFIDKRKKKK